MNVVPIVSGGLDSVTMLYALTRDHKVDLVVSFDYSQRHRRELLAAQYHAEEVRAEHRIIPLAGILAGSVLVDDDTTVPDGHYAEQSMKATVVPGRNLVMLSIAASIAEQREADAVAIAVHGGDHFIYPDCRSDFINAAGTTISYSTEGRVGLLAPFIDGDKTDIVTRAAELGVPVVDTWSCYKGGLVHCGTCGTCVERREAFSLAGVVDPTEYASTGPLPAAP